MIPAIVILARVILVSGLREYLAEIKVSVPVTRLAKWKTAIQMVALGFLIVGDAGPAAIPVHAIGEAGLWIAALLTALTGHEYMSRGLKHMVGQDSRSADRRVGKECISTGRSRRRPYQYKKK